MSNGDHQSYEVQIYHNKRWIVHASYGAHERGRAVLEAKDLNAERPHIPVRVIMEDYRETSGRHDEILIYRNKAHASIQIKQPRKWADMTVSTESRIGYIAHEFDDFLDPFETATPVKPKVSFGMLLAIIGMIFIIGATSGVVAAAILIMLMNVLNLSIDGNSRHVFVVAMFVLVWIIGSASSLNYYKAKFDLNPFGRQKKTPPPVQQSEIAQEMEKAAEEIDKIPVQKVDLPEEPEELQNLFEKPNVEIQIDDDDVELSEEAQKQKMFLITFLGTCLSALKGPESDKATLNRFALNMFMTGAVCRMVSEHGLSSEEEFEILCRILEMLGAKADQAETFAMEYERHLNNPRHRELFDYAGDIAVRYADGDQAAPLYIRETIETWVHWKPTIEEHINPHLLTIMFTDMVGSTDLTTKHGDYAAQEVLKAHDMIVRTALTNFEGKEIKHLGDGIMASFKDFNLAIQAAIEIQKRVEGNNNAGPEFPLHVRIGLNAGEPIKKNNDLFGTSVQLAARLCDKCPSDHILLSQDLVNLFGEQPVFTFIDAGPQELKGFDVPQSVYQLDWKAPPIEYDDPSGPSEEGAVVEDQASQAPHAPDTDVLPVQNPIEEDPNFDAGLPLQHEESTENVLNEEDQNSPKTV